MRNTPTLQVIHLTGTDTCDFLQGLITADVNALDHTAVLSACCNQRGRMVANFWIWKASDGFYLALPDSMQSTLVTHLKHYRLRAAVNIDSVTKIKIPKSRTSTPPIWIMPTTSEQLTPQMINLEKHGGVSFKKGCYLGQEIITRTEHLGQLKRHLYTFINKLDTPIAVGDSLCNSEKQKMGIVVALQDNHIIAVIEDRAVEHPMLLNGKTIPAPSRHY